MGQTNVKNLGNGGTMDGDVTITGDLTVSGGIGLSLSEVIEGTSTIDVTNTEALLVRKNGDGGDVFTVDTTNSAVEVGGHLTLPDASGSGGVLKLGASEDIQIYHDGSNSYLDHLNTGNLNIRSLRHGGDIVFHTEASDGTQHSILTLASTGNVGINTGSNDIRTKLHIETTANSISSTDVDVSELPFIIMNPANDDNEAVGIGFGVSQTTTNVGAAIIHDRGGSNSYGNLHFATKPNGGGGGANIPIRMTISESGNIGINKTAPAQLLHLAHATDASIQLERVDTSVANNDGIGAILFKGGESSQTDIARIRVNADADFTSSSSPTKMTFETTPSGATADAVAMTIDSNQNIGIGEDSPDRILHIKSGTPAIRLEDTATGNGAIGFVEFYATTTMMGSFGFGSTSNSDIDLLNAVSGGHIDYTTTGTASQHRFLTNESTTNFIIDNNSRISLSNNDSSGAVGTTLFGYNAGLNIVSGAVSNTFIGHEVADATLTNAADYNTGVGGSALGALTSGYSNAAFGFQSLFTNTDGFQNTAIGTSALYHNAGTDNNTAVGDQAGFYTTGANNTYVGQSAGRGGSGAETNNVGVGHNSLLAITTGARNVAIGIDAGKAITSANRNTAIGYQALYSEDADGDRTIAIGHQALYSQNGDTEAMGNTAVGYISGFYNVTGTNNTYMGYGSGGSGAGSTNSHSNNTGIGYKALEGVTTGGNNVALGQGSLQSLSSSGDNTAVGQTSLAQLSTGHSNTALGRLSGTALTTGLHNTAIGRATLYSAAHDEGSNVAIGSSAMQAAKQDGTVSSTNREVKRNIAIGTDALFGGTLTGARHLESNIAIGHQALDATGAHEQIGTIAIGTSALGALTDGQFNVAIGYETAKHNATGGLNTWVGYQAGLGASGQSNSQNTGVGYRAGYSITTGSNNTFLGRQTGLVMTDGADNTFVGMNAGAGTVSGTQMVAIGNQSLFSNATADASGTVAVGYSALNSLTSGIGNVVVGSNALEDITTGSYNTVVGMQAMQNAQTGVSLSTAVGFRAGYKLGDDGASDHSDANIMIGYSALGGGSSTIANNTANHNIAIGNNSLGGGSSTASTMAGNTVIGHDASKVATNGADNTVIGKDACATMTTGYFNTVIGKGANPSADGGTNQIVIGRAATGQGNNSVTLGNVSVTEVYMSQSYKATVFCGKIKNNNSTIDTTASYSGLENKHTKTAGASDSSDDFIGLETSMTFNDADAGFSNLMGIYSETHAQSAGGENTTGYGLYNRLQMSGSTDVNTLYGEYGFVDVNAGTVDGDIYGKFLDVDIESGCTIGNDVYGFQMNVDSDTNPTGGVTAFYIRLDGNGDKFMDATDVANSTDRFEILSTGVVNAEGTINASQSMDYAEYFESKDGKEIAVGTTVKLDGNKIVACSDGDTPLGVIRPKSGNQIVGGGQMFHWEGMFMKDDYGASIWEDYTKVQWTEEITLEEYNKRGKDETGGALGGSVKDSKVKGSEAIKAKDAVLDEDGKEIEPAVDAVDAVPDKYYRKHKYHSDRLPDGVTAPKDAKVIKIDKQRQKLNPDYDVSKSYQSREKRTEWHIVGLLGQIPITKGQPVASNWIKMKDVSDTVEMYFVK